VLLVGELLSKGSNIGTDLMSLEKRLREAYEDLKMLKEEFSGYYTKDQVDASLDAIYTKTEIDARPYVIETGSNADDNWVKWSNGKLECFGISTFTGLNITTGAGSLYRIASPVYITWPQVFSTAPIAVYSVSYATTLVFIGASNVSPSVTQSAGLYVLKYSSDTNYTVKIAYKAIGRWQA
jgi:hypothetical protein